MFTLRAHGQLYVDQTTGDAWTCEHAQTARRYARALAISDAANVDVLRNGRAAYTVLPDGRCTPPPLMQIPERERCTRGTGKACFCSSCRAERRAARQ